MKKTSGFFCAAWLPYTLGSLCMWLYWLYYFCGRTPSWLDIAPGNTTVYFAEPDYLLVEGLVPALLFLAAGLVGTLYFAHTLKAGGLRFPLICGVITLAVTAAVYILLFVSRNIQPLFIAGAVCLAVSCAAYAGYLAKALKKEKAAG